MFTIITGTDGVIYHGYGRPLFGHWGQALKGEYPYYITLGGLQYYLVPPPYSTKYSHLGEGMAEPFYYSLFR